MKKHVDGTLILLLAATTIGFVFLHDLLGGTLFAHCEWDSYTLQALAWREGRLSLAEGYSWLELAYYGGNWFVSFPPVPSLVMLPLTFLFGEKTPNNFLMLVYLLISLTLAYKCLTEGGAKRRFAAFWAAFAVLGTNMLWMSTMGGVWFLAQSLCMALCFGTVLCAMKGRRTLAMTLLAFAVGCRPFAICYFPVLIWDFYRQDREKNPRRKPFETLFSQWKYWLIPAAIGAAYMLYNYARFDNPFEFGHNYLPEFAQEKQFSLTYLLENFKNIFFRPVTLTSQGRLSFAQFNGFMFYIANPIFLIFFARLIRDLVKKRLDGTQKMLCVALAANLFFLMIHKTFGGWQFGARYTVDLIPFALWFLIRGGLEAPKKSELFAGIFAVLFNAYGALAMTFILG